MLHEVCRNFMLAPLESPLDREVKHVEEPRAGLLCWGVVATGAFISPKPWAMPLASKRREIPAYLNDAACREYLLRGILIKQRKRSGNRSRYFRGQSLSPGFVG
jgi:hypothetical protein